MKPDMNLDRCRIFKKWQLISLYMTVFISLIIIPLRDVNGVDKLVTIDVKTDEIINEDFRGFGVEADPFLWMKENRERGVGIKDIELCIKRIKNMKLDIVRIFTVIEWWQPDRNVFTWESDGMISLCKSLDVYEVSGTDVIITIWGRIPNWLKPEGNVPTDMESFTSSITKFLEYLIIHKKYSCIKYLIIYNEPDKEFQKPFSEYLNMYKQVAEKLEDFKIRDRVKLVGPDEAVDENWFKMATLNGDVFDIFDSHTYAFQNGSDAEGWMVNRMNYIKENTGKAKQWFITEFGIQSPNMNAFQNPALDTSASSIFAADFAITAINQGASAVLIWCLHDICYPTEGEKIMEWGLWKYVNEGWKERPTYYAWRLITRYTEKGSKVIRTISNDPDISVALLETNSKRYSYLVLNKSEKPKKIIVMHPEDSSGLRKHEYVPGKTMDSEYSGKIQQGHKIKYQNGYFEDTIDGNRFIIYSNKKR